MTALSRGPESAFFNHFEGANSVFFMYAIALVAHSTPSPTLSGAVLVLQVTIIIFHLSVYDAKYYRLPRGRMQIYGVIEKAP
jgi:hypothetical protein